MVENVAHDIDTLSLLAVDDLDLLADATKQLRDLAPDLAVPGKNERPGATVVRQASMIR